VEELLAFLPGALLDGLGEFLIEWLYGLGAESLSGLFEREEQDSVAASVVKIAAVGVAAGLLSAGFLPHRVVTAHVVVPGASILPAPLATGIAMHLVGKKAAPSGASREQSQHVLGWSGLRDFDGADSMVACWRASLTALSECTNAVWR
jgi:hypothetical protein